MPIMLRAPSCKPFTVSDTPTRTEGITCCLRNQAISGLCVSIWITMDTTAQNADRPADNCSTDRHHTSTPIGIMKYRPARTVGQVSGRVGLVIRSEEHTSELQSLMRISYAVFSLKKKKNTTPNTNY